MKVSHFKLYSRFILHPCASSLCFMRDGVTGNTSGFELEDEGSTPSPAANLFQAQQKVLRFITNYRVLICFIRRGWVRGKPHRVSVNGTSTSKNKFAMPERRKPLG